MKLNRLTILGRITKDIELKTSQANKPFANFSVAVQREMDREKADFLNCVAFGKTAENIAKFFEKGSQILLEGSIQIDENDGKYYTKVMVNRFWFVDNKKSNRNEEESTTQVAKQEDNEAFYESSMALANSDDLPF
jgi:single-strand DNA-binding protein